MSKALTNLKLKEEEPDRIAGREDQTARRAAGEILNSLGVTDLKKLPDDTVQTGLGRLRFNVAETPGNALGVGATKGKTLDIEWRPNVKKIHGKDVIVDKEFKVGSPPNQKTATVIQRTTLTDDKGQPYMVAQAIGQDGKPEGDAKYYKAKLDKVTGVYETDGKPIPAAAVPIKTELDAQHIAVATKLGEKYSLEAADGNRIVADASRVQQKRAPGMTMGA